MTEHEEDLRNQLRDAISTTVRSEGYSYDADSIHTITDKVMEVVFTAGQDSPVYRNIIAFMNVLGEKALDKTDLSALKRVRSYIKDCGFDWKAFYEFGRTETRRLDIIRLQEVSEELREALDARNVLLKLRGRYSDVKESKELNKKISSLETELSRLASLYPDHATDLCE